MTVSTLKIQDCEFIAQNDGTLQRYMLRLPDAFNLRHPVPLLIALHGHGADRKQFIYDPRDECRAIRDLAERYQMILLSPDYRAPDSWMGPTAEQDMLQLIQEIKERFSISQVVLSGGSMGGTSALIFTVLYPNLVDGVIALNPMANMLEYSQEAEGITPAIEKAYGGSQSACPGIYRQRSAELHPDIFTMPLAITTGGMDAVVPPESAIRLVEVLKKQGRPVLHLHRPATRHETNYADAMEVGTFVLDNCVGAL